MYRFVNLAGIQDSSQDDILKKLDEIPLQMNAKSVHGGVLVSTDDIDDYGAFSSYICLHTLHSQTYCSTEGGEMVHELLKAIVMQIGCVFKWNMGVGRKQNNYQSKLHFLLQQLFE